MQIILQRTLITLFMALACTTIPMVDKKPFALMLAPAGDVRVAGRTIGEQFERGIALPFAQYIAKKIGQEISPITVVYSHMPGESLSGLQQANFCNRMGIDLYINLSFYHEEQTKPRIQIYRFSTSTLMLPKPPVLSFIPFDNAYTINESKTITVANFLYQQLSASGYQSKFSLMSPLAIPFKPLIGISAPALGIEIGIKSNLAWQEYADIIATQLIALINSMN